MALKLVKENGYGIVEFNNMSAQRVGRTKAQLPLESTVDFADKTMACENGMLLVYDEAAGVVKRPTAITDNVMLHKSEEKLYDPARPGLKDFALFGESITTVTITNPDSTTTAVNFGDTENPYPRLYQMDIGDTWTTNTVIYDDGDYADFDAIIAAFDAGTEIWGQPAVGLAGAEAIYNGYVKLVTAKPATALKPLKVVEVYTLPSGVPGIKFEVFPRG